MAKRKKINSAVQIYERKTQNGITLYLHYSLNGEQLRENTGLRLTGDPVADEVTRKAVQILQAQKTTDLINGKTGLSLSTKANDAAKVRLSDFVRLVGSEKSKIGTQRNYNSVAQKLDEFTKLRLCDANEKEVKKIIDYLADNLKPQTVQSYTATICGALNVAKKRRLIKENPFDFLEKSDRPQKPKTKRDYLSEEELNAFIKTVVLSANEREIKDAFIFSAFTGLRYIDIYNLTAKNFEVSGDTIRVKTDTQKTGETANFVLPNSAAEIVRYRITESEKTGGKIFQLSNNVTTNYTIKRLSEKAKISQDKHVTFHTARHTFATLLITKGASVFAVSKLLGHADVKTTQIYAELVGKKKDETISLLNNL